MKTTLSATTRRSVGTAALFLALAELGGCMGASPSTVPNSMSSYERTFDTALGAMTDQKLTISQRDLRLGTIVGTAGGITISATLEPLYDGTIRVSFKQQGESPTDAGLVKRVADSYNERMSRAKLLPGG